MEQKNAASIRAAFIAVTTLFFAWGFITSLIDPLVAAVKGIFTLTDFQAQLSASAFFIAYGLISFPAATLIAKLRPVPAILLALGMMAGACLVMLGAANIASYTLVLVGLFGLASGITILQVAANPLAAALGKPEGSHFRLTLSQTFNSFGTFIGPIIGAGLFLQGVEVKEGVTITPEVRANALAGIDRAYFWICGLLLLLLVFFWLSRRTVSSAAPEPAPAKGIAAMIAEAFASRWAMIGGAAIFLYVGAEVAIGTQMAFFLNDNSIWGQSDAAFGVPLLGTVMGNDGVPGVSLQEAARAVAFYWGGAMVGRAIGTVLLARIPAARLLAVFTAAAAAMCIYVFAVGGVTAGFVALSIGLFNSIMFPVIFTLTLERSTASEEATSGMLCTSIIGGAFLPPLVGVVSGMGGYVLAFCVPAACYVLLFGFALAAGNVARTRAVEEAPAGH
ncbi:MFS transporter [Altererythrobacter sp.]|uniref:MFS transporter n=1 Tax=Altererythrobacter sp. TaxID=1872480 RepID=UPI003D01D4C6